MTNATATVTPATPLREVATFWHGPPLARLDVACLMSFVAAGYDVTVYGFDPIGGLPDGVRFGRADDIVERRYLHGFVVKGKPSIAHFSDLFRLRLFAATDAAWVDMDLLHLRPFEMPRDGHFLARETSSSINNSILRIDRRGPQLAGLIAEVERYGNGADFVWGSTGPALLTRTYSREAFDAALPPHRFFPVPWDEWWKPFTPSARDECEALCADAYGIHLWNNIVERSGYWKEVAPPAGSYLHAVFAREGLLGLFDAVYPAAVVEHIAENYRNLRTAKHMKVKELASITATRFVQAVGRKVGGDA